MRTSSMIRVWLFLYGQINGLLAVRRRDDLIARKRQADHDQFAYISVVFGNQYFCHLTLTSHPMRGAASGSRA